jgi:NAD(P)-dependent dehydrogenase (short-subunit alcohol dehydrogenase family)
MRPAGKRAAGSLGSPWVQPKLRRRRWPRYFAVALAQKGITVNIISPGACDDSVLSGLPPQVFQMIKDWHESGWTPMRRLGVPADVGNAVVLLCTDHASFITGQLLYVDGGASAMEPVFPLAIQGIK